VYNIHNIQKIKKIQTINRKPDIIVIVAVFFTGIVFALDEYNR
jgi:ABC-type Fe2+-enterobactin transport system substrate-binding protein